eukprot:TRINITY_DN11187_c0_g4_i1.p1 TRINITY_DN11187_c0_g4~~TRINITY_DN11187_c0_g4_i1.p1  ORF type:complete len:1458 (+),score=342.26 TRINITY_DN11187_c0_g4_i1:284-4657(+)
MSVGDGLSTGERYWVPDDDLVWTPALLKAKDAKNATLIKENEAILTLPLEKFAELDKVQDEQLDGIDDICELPSVSEGAMLHTVRVRYERQAIYTQVARVLIAVNPFRALPLYTAQHLDRYRAASDVTELPPHIFGLSQAALRGLRTARENVVLIGGESGAGKTETAKLILSFIMGTARCADGDISEKILRTSPIFESFGNAMTVRNNNSSRFGKWLDIHFTKSLDIVDCSFTRYLLETTRVVSHGAGERSYHIFYQLVAGRDKLPSLGIGDVQSYNYLKAGELRAPGVDDSQSFEETLEAFGLLGFAEETQTEIISIVAGILMLGNCDMRAGSDEGSELIDEAPVQKAAALLGVSSEDLRQLLICKTLMVGGQAIHTKLKPEQARSVRDTLAQAIYGRLFDWLVMRMNALLCLNSQSGKEERHSSLGILDMAGFECFDKNSLEQLLINYANEHLQQSFGNTIVKAELDEYIREGISVEVKFTDNSDVLELIDGKDGILDRLDEEGNLPKGTDEAYASKLVKTFTSHPRFVTPKFGGKPEFGIKHFAGEVVYGSEGFLEKNMMKFPEGAEQLLGGSSTSLLPELAQAGEKPQPGRKQKQPSACKAFRESLRVLKQQIANAERHYVRCIKPNKEKVPNVFDSGMSMQQMLFSGIVDAVRVRHQGYSLRMSFADFMKEYGCIVQVLGGGKASGFDPSASDERVVEELLKRIPQVLSAKAELDPPAIVIGKTKVFVKSAAMATLNRGREKALIKFATCAQSGYRGKLDRQRVNRMKECRKRLVSWLVDASVYDQVAEKVVFPEDCFSIRFGTREAACAKQKELRELLTEASNLCWQTQIVRESKQICRRLEQELDVGSALDALETSIDVMAIERELARAEGLNLPKAESLANRLAKLRVQVPFVGLMEDALRMNVGDDINDEIGTILKQAESVGLLDDDAWVPQLSGPFLVPTLLERRKMELECRAKEEAARKAEREKADAERRKREAEERRQKCEALIASLEEATLTYDARSLQELLGRALQLGLEDKAVEAAQKMFKTLQNEGIVLVKLYELESASRRNDAPEHTFRSLQNLCDQIQRLKGDEERTRGARRELALHAADTRRTRLASGLEGQDSSFADHFMDVSTFAGLKLASSWRGHRHSIMIPQAGRATVACGGYEQMLGHSTVTIAEALTVVPANKEDRAVQNFRDILVWMGDRYGPDCQRQASRGAVLALAREDASLRDEVFVQMLKQLSGNPNSRSELRGWQLMLQLCVSMAPSAQVVQYVHAKLEQEVSANRTPSSDIADVCLKALCSFEDLPELRGYLLKKSPALLRATAYDQRYFKLQDTRLFWWRTKEEADEPQAAVASGGPRCKGILDLVAGDSEVIAERVEGPPGTARFSLRTAGEGWSESSLIKKIVNDRNKHRVYVFDAHGSEHDRDKWIDTITAHVRHAQGLRERRRALEAGEGIPMLTEWIQM